MFKQSPSRNQRSKGFKVKHILQICVLLAVCFWLIYQVKHSHDKKKAFDESEAKISIKDHVHDEIVRLGRKDIHPHLEERTVGNGKPDEEEAEEDETGAGEEDKQHEEEEQEEENKTEEKDDEGRGDGDDEIDENDQDKSELEVEREEELLDDEKEREIDEKESEDKEGQNEQESSLEDHDQGGVSRNAHEAREEHYKADDASSAVTHEAEATDAETEAESSENSGENNETDALEEGNKSNKTDEIWANQNNTGLAAREGEMAENGILQNVTGKEQEIQEMVSSKPKESLISNSTVTTESNNEQVASNKTTESNPENNNLYLQNVTQTKTDSVEVQNATAADTASDGSGLQSISLGQVNNTSHAALDKELPNLVVSHDTENAGSAMGESSNASNVTELTTPEKVIKSNESVQFEEISNATQNEKAESSEGKDGSGTDERVDASKDENIEEVHNDPIDRVDSGFTLEKDVRTDLETLPEIRTEGSNNEDAAAE